MVQESYILIIMDSSNDFFQFANPLATELVRLVHANKISGSDLYADLDALRTGSLSLQDFKDRWKSPRSNMHLQVGTTTLEEFEREVGKLAKRKTPLTDQERKRVNDIAHNLSQHEENVPRVFATVDKLGECVASVWQVWQVWQVRRASQVWRA